MKHLKKYELFESNGVTDDVSYIINASLIDLSDIGYKIHYSVNLNAYWGCKVLFIRFEKDTGYDKLYNISDLNNSVNELIGQLKDQYLLLDYHYLTGRREASTLNIEFGVYKSGDPIILPNEIGYGFYLMFAKTNQKIK